MSIYKADYCESWYKEENEILFGFLDKLHSLY